MAIVAELFPPLREKQKPRQASARTMPEQALAPKTRPAHVESLGLESHQTFVQGLLGQGPHLAFTLRKTLCKLYAHVYSKISRFTPRLHAP